MKTLLLMSIIAASASLMVGCKKDSAPTAPAPVTKSIETGLPSQLASQSVPAGGGTVTVALPGDTMNGLTVTVADSTFVDSRTITITSAPITSHSFGANLNPISPLLTFRNGGGMGAQPMTVHVPVHIPAGMFALAFAYDSKLGKLEALPLVAEDSAGITFMTAHFTTPGGNGGPAAHVATGDAMSVLISSVAESKLDESGWITTGFVPGRDDWEFINEGSFIAPGGHCAGQTMTMMWYFIEHRRMGEKQLNGLFDRIASIGWENNLGMRFASTVQCDLNWHNTLRSGFRLLRYLTPSLQWKAFAAAMLVTEEPQYVGIYKEGTGGHAIVANMIDYHNGTLGVVDPNIPGQQRQITFSNGVFNPYESNLRADDNSPVMFDRIGFFAKTALVDWSDIGTRWLQLLDSTIGNDKFPAAEIKYIENGIVKPVGDTVRMSGDSIEWDATPQGLTMVLVDMGGNNIPKTNAWEMAVAPGVQTVCMRLSGAPTVDCNGFTSTATKRYIVSRFITINNNNEPQIIRLDRTSALLGGTLIITGARFGQTRGSSSVRIGAGTVTEYAAWSDAEIKLTVPSEATSGDVIVTVGGVPSNGVHLEVVSGGIAAVRPDSAYPGMVVRITGSGFGPSKNQDNDLYFMKSDGSGMHADSILSWSDGLIEAKVPTAPYFHLSYAAPETVFVQVWFASSKSNTVPMKLYTRMPEHVIRSRAFWCASTLCAPGSYSVQGDALAPSELPAIGGGDSVVQWSKEGFSLSAFHQSTNSGWKYKASYSAAGTIDSAKRTISVTINSSSDYTLDDTTFLRTTASVTVANLPMSDATPYSTTFSTGGYTAASRTFDQCITDLSATADYMNYPTYTGTLRTGTTTLFPGSVTCAGRKIEVWFNQ
jgi:hypothetical protein